MRSSAGELGDLNSTQYRDLCDCAQLLEDTLKDGALSVDLRRYLPPPGAPHRRTFLLELIKTELEIRYRLLQKCPLEEFVRRYPELGGPEKLPPSLVYEEYRVRWLYGDCLPLDEYRARFPLQFEELTRLVRQNPLPEPPPSAPTPTLFGTAIPPGNGYKPPPKSERVEDVVLEELTGYTKQAFLGNGAFGEVWTALAPGDVEVALKVMLSALDHAATRRELKALEKIKQLRHPFLLKTQAFGLFENKLGIVMELADGSLSDRDQECKAEGLKGIPLDELVAYFGQAAEALDYLDAQHVAHRDIKPQNLLRLKGFAKVADFGLARAQDQLMDDVSVMCGSPHYMAPEVWQQKVHRHSDQYSLAATYVELRLGRHLFPGKGLHQVAEQHRKSEPKLDPLPAAEQAVLKQALAKDPDQRFPTCVAFTRALKEATSPKPVVPSQGWGAKVAIAFLTFALAALLVFRYFFPPAPGTPPTLQVLVPSPDIVPRLKGWEPVDSEDIVEDRNSRRYYRRQGRQLGGQQVVVLLVPRIKPTDPESFYIMENKVWNDLYAVFMSDPKAQQLFKQYSSRPGCDRLVSPMPQPPLPVAASVVPLWRRGGYAPAFNPVPDKEPFFGVDGPKGRLPVFRVTVTEAHCFAEWLDGRLPSKKQWLKAAGKDEDVTRQGPFDGAPEDTRDLAVGLLTDGPWPVDRGERDRSIYRCRQMASNGKEWTRDLADKEPGAAAEIPLEEMKLPRHVSVLGQTYLSEKPLIWDEMNTPPVEECTKASYEVTFRVVLEP